MASRVDRAESDDHVRFLYNSVAASYADRFCSEEVLRAEQPYVAELLSISHASGRAVLDIGCGPAVYWPLAAQLGVQYLGVDFAFEMLRIGRQRYPMAGLVQGDARWLPVASAVARVAVAMGSFSHMAHDALTAAVREAARSLGRGGAFLLGDQLGTDEVVQVPYPLSPGSIVKVYPRTESLYHQILMAEGFDVVRSQVRCPEAGEIVLKKLLVWAKKR